MTRKLITALSAAGLSGLVCTSAVAHPIDVLRDSGEVYISDGWARHDGQSVQLGHHVVSKTPGTLNMELPLSILGLETSQSVSAVGTRHGDEVWWEFDQPLELSLPDLNSTRRIEGRLITRVTEMGAGTRLNCTGGPCPYSLLLDGLDRGSAVRLHGTAVGFADWEREADIGFELFSGPPRPRLEQFDVVRTSKVCSRTVKRHFTAELVLDGEAPERGTLVEVVSSDPDVIVPSSFHVGADLRRTTFEFEVPADYTGSFDLVAAAGGIQLTQSLTVEPDTFCVPYDAVFALDDLEADLLCRGCLDDLQLADDGVAVGSSFFRWFLRDPEGYIVEVGDLVGGIATSVSLGARGDLAAYSGRRRATVVMSRLDLGGEPVWHEDFVAQTVDPRGVVYGAVLPDTTEIMVIGSPGPVPAFIAGERMFLAPLAESGSMPAPPAGPTMPGPGRPRLGGGTSSNPVPSYNSPIDVLLGITYPNGDPPLAGATLERSLGTSMAIGSQRSPDGTTQFVSHRRDSSPLYLAPNSFISGTNAAHDLAGTRYSQGLPQAFIASLDGNRLLSVDTSSSIGTVAMGIDETGTLAVNIVAHEVLGGENDVVAAALWSPQTGFVYLEDLLNDGEHSITVHEILRVNHAFDLSVRGTIDGEPAVFGLRNLSSWGSAL